MELWKLNTVFKLFLLSIAAFFLLSAFLHYTLVLHYLPVILVIGVALYISTITNPALRKRPSRIYILSTTIISTALVASIVIVGYSTLSTTNSCHQAGTVPLDWAGNVIIDSERHPYLDTGTTYQFNFNLLSGPGYRLRVTQDPFSTPVLHLATLSGLTNLDQWNFAPASCGTYWIELLNLGFGTQQSSYHVTVTSIAS